MFSTTGMTRKWFVMALVVGCANGRTPVAPAVHAGATGSGSPVDGTSDGAGAPAAAPPAPARPSAGCSGGGINAGLQERTLDVDGRSRSYSVVMPAAARNGAPLPLVFAWHGLGGSGARARGYFGLEEAADGAALLVYPDAVPLPSFANRTGWDLRPEGPDLRFFDAMLAAVEKSNCVDLARVFSTGHSFGGYMTNALGCYRAAVLRGIAPVAGGLVPGGCMIPPALPAWIAHAMNDSTVPFARGEAARTQWATASGCRTGSQPVSPAPCVAFEGCRPAAPVVWCVHDQGHAWPAFAGPAIWAFFSTL